MDRKITNTVANKSVAIMAADVNALTPVPRKNYGDYPQCSLLETATIAIAKTLCIIFIGYYKNQTHQSFVIMKL